MSEIRRVSVKMKDLEAIKESCIGVGCELVEEKNRIVVKNHGIRTYAGTPVSLVLQRDGTYQLEGDCPARELEKLAVKIRAH